SRAPSGNEADLPIRLSSAAPVLGREPADGFSHRATAGASVPATSDVLPAPLTPETTHNAPSGNSTVRFWRLFVRHPLNCNRGAAAGSRRFARWAGCRWPDNHGPVTEPSAVASAAGGPSNVIRPPSGPAAGPISSTWSDAFRNDSLCSTTTTVFRVARSDW